VITATTTATIPYAGRSIRSGKKNISGSGIP
jgi:hypothetical protein